MKIIWIRLTLEHSIYIKKGFYCNTQDQGLKGNYNFDLKTN